MSAKSTACAALGHRRFRPRMRGVECLCAQYVWYTAIATGAWVRLRKDLSPFTHDRDDWPRVK